MYSAHCLTAARVVACGPLRHWSFSSLRCRRGPKNLLLWRDQPKLQSRAAQTSCAGGSFRSLRRRSIFALKQVLQSGKTLPFDFVQSVIGQLSKESVELVQGE